MGSLSRLLFPNPPTEPMETLYLSLPFIGPPPVVQGSLDQVDPCSLLQKAPPGTGNGFLPDRRGFCVFLIPKMAVLTSGELSPPPPLLRLPAQTPSISAISISHCFFSLVEKGPLFCPPDLNL